MKNISRLTKYMVANGKIIAEKNDSYGQDMEYIWACQ